LTREERERTLSMAWINMIKESVCSGEGMTCFEVDNNVKNLRAAILQHSDVSLAAWTMVTNLT
jgi:hypothetical protein